MTPADAIRESIAALEAALAAQRAALAELDAQPHAAPPPRPASLIGANLKTVKEAAGMLGFSEKTVRKIAPAIGAERRLARRIFVDMNVFAEQLAGKTLPKSSTARPEKTCDSPSRITGGKEQTR
jgi:hypothetical protein